MAQTLDKQILQYLPLLGSDEKRSILSVIKSFVSLKKEETEVVYSDAFIAELDRRTAAYKSGAAPGVTAEESKRRIDELLKR